MVQIEVTPKSEEKKLSHGHTGWHSWSGAPGSGAVAHPTPTPCEQGTHTHTHPGGEQSPPHTTLKPHSPNNLVSISLVVSCPSLLVPAGPRLETACLLFALRGLASLLPNALGFFWSRGWGRIFSSLAPRHGWYLEGNKKPDPDNAESSVSSVTGMDGIRHIGFKECSVIQHPRPWGLRPLRPHKPKAQAVGASLEQRLGVRQRDINPGQEAGKARGHTPPSSPSLLVCDPEP